MRFRRSTKQAPKTNGRRIRKLRLLALVLVLGIFAFASFMFGLMTAIASQLPQYDPAHQQKIAHDGYIYDRNGQLLAVLRGKESRVILNSDQIAPIMKQAIVSIEDKRFYEHNGVDLHAIGRALLADIEHKSVVQGGSTITQQFIKNSYVADNRSIARKLKEAALAWQLEQRHRDDKDWILTAYLNTIYFGNGAYGIGQAALTYFQKPASKLTLPEAALLAGIPRDPSLFDPVTNPKASKERRRVVLDQMLQQGIIAPDQYHAARTAALPAPEKVRLPGTRETQGQYFINYVKQQLVSNPDYGAGAVFGGGLRIHTTLDLGLQKMARKAISKVLTDPNGPQAALVAIDPRDGKVLAMVGGASYRESQFNLAVQGERQPGSAFKPFVLATALKEGISPATHFTSHPVVIPLGDKLWQVNNYEGEYLGSIDLTSATVHSDNSVYAQLTSIVGPENVAKMARNAGIRSKLNSYFAIGLGAEAANPLEMARAYSTFANNGNRIDGSILGNEPRAITQIGKNKNAVVSHRVLSPTKTAILNSILQKVVDRGHRPSRGARRPPRRRQDRDDRELRRRVVRRVRAAADRRRLGRLSARAEADGDRVPRRSGCRRDVPGRDLARVHGEGAAVSQGPAGVVPVHVHPVRLSARGGLPRRSAPARQRALQLCAEPALFRQAGAEQDRELQAERGRRSGSDRAAGGGRSRAARRAAADAVDRLQVRKGRTEARRRARAEAEQGAIVGV